MTKDRRHATTDRYGGPPHPAAHGDRLRRGRRGWRRSPTDAAKQDFCNQSVKLLQAKTGADVRAWAAGMKKVGTPKGITASQRKGFERTIELASKSKGTGTQGSLGSVDPQSADGRNVLAFIEYAENTCPDSFKDALATAAPSS